MKKITAVVLFICMLSFLVVPAMAAQDTIPGDRVITPGQRAVDRLNELNDLKVFEQRATHSKADFTNVVPGVGGLKYKAEQVPPGFEHIPETVTMVSWQDNGKLHIRDIEHKTTTIQIPWTTLQDIKGFDSQHVRIWHYNDEGVCDGKWVQKVSNEGGYAYLEDVPFSEVIVGGFTGTYSKVETEINIIDTINLGRTFDSDEVSSLTLTIDDQYSKTDPYDIPTDNLVFWGRFDDAGSTVIDYSGNGNNGTFAAATYATGKYNNGILLNGVVGVGYVPDADSLRFYENDFSIVVNNYQDAPDDGYIITKGNPTEVGDWGVAIFSGNLLFRVEPSHDITTTLDVKYGEFEEFVIVRDGDRAILYRNGQLDNSIDGFFTGYNLTSIDPLSIGARDGPDVFLNGTLDNIQLYNRPLSQTEVEELYYISARSIQGKTNSHDIYSEEWDGVSDINIPFGESESISSIGFNQSDSIVQNGVTIYDPINMLFNVTATVGYTEDTYLIEEFCNEGFYLDQYAIEITHTPSASNANGLISYNPTDCLASEVMAGTWTYNLESNNPNASITTFNMNSLIIDTGSITQGTTYTYTVTAEATHIMADGNTATQQGASIWGTGVSILNVAFMISIIAAGLVALKNANDPEKSAKPALEALVALAIGLLVFTLIATLGTGLGSAIETLLGV